MPLAEGANLNGTASGGSTDLRFDRSYRASPTGLAQAYNHTGCKHSCARPTREAGGDCCARRGRLGAESQNECLDTDTLRVLRLLLAHSATPRPNAQIKCARATHGQNARCTELLKGQGTRPIRFREGQWYRHKSSKSTK
eukprot:6175469-Pleurochrysis_carterae.AAC.3